MKLHFEEIVELIHRKMYVRNGVMLGSKAAAKAILQAEEAAQQKRVLDLPICQRCQIEKQILYRCPHCQFLESASQ